MALISSQEPTEFSVFEPCGTSEHRPQVAPQDAPTTDDVRLFKHSVERYGEDIVKRRAHEVLAEPPAQPSDPEALLAAPHLAQVHEPEIRAVVRAGDPAF